MVSAAIEGSVDHVIQHEAHGKTGCEDIALGSSRHILIEGGQGYEAHNDGKCNGGDHGYEISPIEHEIWIVPDGPEEIIEGPCDRSAEKTNDRDRFRREHVLSFTQEFKKNSTQINQ